MQYTVHFSHTFVIISQVLLCMIYQFGFELGIDLKYCLRFMNKLNSLSAKLDNYFVTEYAPVVKRFTKMWKDSDHNDESVFGPDLNQIKSFLIFHRYSITRLSWTIYLNTVHWNKICLFFSLCILPCTIKILCIYIYGRVRILCYTWTNVHLCT